MPRPFEPQWTVASSHTASVMSVGFSRYLAEVVENSRTDHLFLAWFSTTVSARRLLAQRLIMLKLID